MYKLIEILIRRLIWFILKYKSTQLSPFFSSPGTEMFFWCFYKKQPLYKKTFILFSNVTLTTGSCTAGGVTHRKLVDVTIDEEESIQTKNVSLVGGSHEMVFADTTPRTASCWAQTISDVVCA